jgi:hypothetical protein
MHVVWLHFACSGMTGGLTDEAVASLALFMPTEVAAMENQTCVRLGWMSGCLCDVLRAEMSTRKP